MNFDLPKLQKNINNIINKTVQDGDGIVNHVADADNEKLLMYSLDKLSGIGASMVKKPKGLYHFLKKKLYPATEIREYVSKLPEDKKYVGYLPDNWRSNVPDSELASKTKSIQKLLSLFAKKNYSIKESGEEEFAKSMGDLSETLGMYLGKECKVSFVGSGEYGKVFRIQSGGEDLALKIFHSDSDAFNSFNHGNLKEINNAIALNNTLKPSQCSRFYCAKLSDDSEQGAFMLTDFVKDDKTCANKGIKLKRFVLGDDGKSGNIIGNKIVDYGSIYYSSNGKI